MLRLFIIVLFGASIRHGSCMPTRIILEGNRRHLPTPALTSWDLWDTDGGLFSPRISQFDMYRPSFGQLRNFGYPTGKIREEILRMGYNDPHRPSRIFETRCDNFDDIKKRNILMSFGLGTAVRCRRTIRKWTMSEPLYVEEPRWIPLDVTADMTDQSGFDGEDPFILARGKRSISMNQQQLADSGIVTLGNTLRAKRDVLSSPEPIPNSNGDDSMSSVYREFGEYSEDQSGYVQPRDKHSDIMDILSEPFFISRGKKHGSKKYNFPSDTNIQMNSPNSHSNQPKRERRGEIMEQLLKEQDPFYIARGRRSSNNNNLLSLLQEWKKWNNEMKKNIRNSIIE